MGNDQSFNHSIRSQETYVRNQMSRMNPSNNYVSSRKYDSSGRVNTYSRDQIESKLRQEYHGNTSYKNHNSYVLSNDWERMRGKR